MHYKVRTAAAAAKSLQLCPTLCDLIDGSLPGSPVPGILQARTLEWVAISFSNAWKWKVKVKSFSRVRLSAIPWTAAYQIPPSMGLSRQEYWSGVPLPSPKVRTVQFSSVAQLCPTLCDPMNRSRPGLPVPHQLPEFTQTHVHRVSDAIQTVIAHISILAEKAMAPHSSTLAWKIPWTEEPGRLQSMGSRRVRHDWVTSLSLFTFMHWRRKRQPTPVFLPGESQGRRSLVGCSPWGREESDMTERLLFHFSLSCTGEGNGNPLQCSCLENPRDSRAW